jgi:hypothetical protein
VAANTSILELEGEITTIAVAKMAVKAAMRPRIRLIPWTFARTVIARIRRRQATTVFVADVVKRTKPAPGYSIRLFFMLRFAIKGLVVLVLVLLAALAILVDNVCMLGSYEVPFSKLPRVIYIRQFEWGHSPPEQQESPP